MQTAQKKKECPKVALRVVPKEERKKVGVKEAEVRTQTILMAHLLLLT